MILPIAVVQNPKLLALFHPLALRMGAWFLAVLISDMAKLSANKFLWRPKKSIPSGLADGFSDACGSSLLYMQYQYNSSLHNTVGYHPLKKYLQPGNTLEWTLPFTMPINHWSGIKFQFVARHTIF